MNFEINEMEIAEVLKVVIGAIKIPRMKWQLTKAAMLVIMILINDF